MFVGREKELKLLNSQYQSTRFELTVLYGRRRIGKTELIKQFIHGKTAIYYMALQSNAETNLEILSRTVLGMDGLTGIQATFQGYEALLDYLTKKSQDQRLVFVLDEYPYLAEALPEISSLIQKYCDHHWQETKLHLILCGSSMSFMENQVLGAKSPLYGRRTAQIKLKPFTYFETAQMLGGMDKETQAILHCATGGVAEYLKYVNPHADLKTNIVSLFLTASGRLHEEPMNLLKQELREPKLYNSILDAIAKGASKNNEIAGKVNLQTGSLNNYLSNLIELGIVIKEIPIVQSTSRKTIYRIKDGAFRFWYRYVFPNLSAIELDMGEQLYDVYIQKDLANFMGEGFEQICVDYFDKMNVEGQFPALIQKRGRWWGNNPIKKREEEMDLVGLGGDWCIYAEVKWTNASVSLKILTELIEKSHLIASENRYYVVFSKSGFTRSAIAFSESRSDMVLIAF